MCRKKGLASSLPSDEDGRPLAFGHGQRCPFGAGVSAYSGEVNGWGEFCLPDLRIEAISGPAPFPRHAVSSPLPPHQLFRVEELLATLLPPPRSIEDLEEWCAVGDSRTQPLAEVYRVAEQRRIRLDEEWSTLGRILDALRQGLMVCDLAGRVLHANPVIRALLAEDLVRGRISEEISVLVRCVRMASASRDTGNAAPLVRTVQLGTSDYVLRGIHLGEIPGEAEGAVLVVLESDVPEPLSDRILREQLGLTAQEVRIARLLSEGMRNVDIAQELFISRHTVRHHVEKVLLKLGVHSRVEVASLLRAGKKSATRRSRRRSAVLRN